MPKITGTVTIKNLKLGKEISAEAKTREDWTKDKKAQITVKLENLIDEIKKIIWKYSQGCKV